MSIKAVILYSRKTNITMYKALFDIRVNHCQLINSNSKMCAIKSINSSRVCFAQFSLVILFICMSRCFLLKGLSVDDSMHIFRQKEVRSERNSHFTYPQIVKQTGENIVFSKSGKNQVVLRSVREISKIEKSGKFQGT